jgi:hypothetical protein
MGRFIFDVSDERVIIAGYDRPMKTWFAQLYDPGSAYNDWEPAVEVEPEPQRTLGYHPYERKLSGPDVEHGPYPIPTLGQLIGLLHGEWSVDLDDDQRARLGEDGP